MNDWLMAICLLLIFALCLIFCRMVLNQKVKALDAELFLLKEVEFIKKHLGTALKELIKIKKRLEVLERERGGEVGQQK